MKKSTKINPSWKNHTIFEENPSISMSSKIFVKIHAVLKKLPYLPYCPMCPIAPCALLPMCPIPQGPPSVSAVSTKIPFTHVPHCPCAPLSMCCIAHVSKKMSSCQKDVKLSKRCQMSKSQTHGLWRRFTKKIN